MLNSRNWNTGWRGGEPVLLVKRKALPNSMPSLHSLALLARPGLRTRGLLAVILAALVIFPLLWYQLSPAYVHSVRLQPISRIVLWAWEEPEDLRFVNPEETGIAFLAATISLNGEAAIIRPRFQPLLVPDAARLMSVVRIQADSRAELNRSQLDGSVATIVETSSWPRVRAVQVDFDATHSQRKFYRNLLIELRRRLRPAVPISITALASWCLDDDWISALPIDEAVPMLFRMSAGTDQVVARLASGRDFRSPLCRDSLGISTDEGWSALPAGRRVYIFHTKPWDQKTELASLREVRQWR